MEIGDIKPSAYYDQKRLEAGKTKEEQNDIPKVEKIVKGNVEIRKPGVGATLLHLLLPEDIRATRDYIMQSVIVPYIKNAAMDAFHSLLFGSAAPKNRPNNTIDKPSYVNYVNYSKNPTQNVVRNESSGPSVDYRSLYFESEIDAREVLADLVDQIDQYNKTTIGHLFSILGKSTNPSMFNYGWRTLADAQIARERNGGFVLDLPRAIPLD